MARGYEEVLQAMNTNRVTLQQRVAEIRADKRYTSEAKRAMVTAAYTEAMAQHNSLRSELAAAREVTLATARGRAFASRDASTAGQAAYREALAQARAASSDGRQLAALFDQASQTRDYTLLRALALVGHQTDNLALTESVARHDRDVADLLEVEARLGDRQSLDMRLANSVAATAPARPAEVSQTVVNAAMMR